MLRLLRVPICAVALLSLGGAGAARGDEAVLVYAARPGADLRVASAALKRAARAAGRTVLDRPIDLALSVATAGVPDGGSPLPPGLAGSADAGAPPADGGAPDARDAPSAAIGALRTRPSLEGLIALAARARLDGIVVAAIGGPADRPVWTAQRFDAARAQLGAIESVAPTASVDASAARLWGSVAAAPLGAALGVLEDPRLGPRSRAAASRSPEPPRPTEHRRTPFYLSVWFWAGAFVVVLGGVLVATLEGVPPSSGTVRVNGAAFTGK